MSDHEKQKMTDREENPEEADLYIERFRNKQAVHETNLARKKGFLKERRKRVDARVAAYVSKHHADPPDSFYEPVARMERSISLTKDVLSFLRPSSAEDIAYRQRVQLELPKLIEQATPADLPLRFHGCPIYVARDVISSKGLSSSVDRLGYKTSYDVADQVSVTTPDRVEVTLDSYTGLTDESCCVPAGCMFVLLPASAEDEAAGSSMLMSNVDFEAHPEQLYAIVTSSENLDLVQDWVDAAGMDSSKVVEFFEFADNLTKLAV